MTRTLHSPSRVRVEHLLINWGDGGAMSSLPLVVSDDPKLLVLMHNGLGFDDFSPMEWWFSMIFDPVKPVEASVTGYFNRAAGHRLAESLRALTGKQWRWKSPARTRHFFTASGHAGRVQFPVARLWQSQDGALPKSEPFELFESCARPSPTRQWHRRLGFHNDGMVTIDLSRVRGIDPAKYQEVIPQIVERLLRDQAIWGQVGKYEGLFEIRVRGHLTDLLDGGTSPDVRWKLRRKPRVRRCADVRFAG